MTDGNFALVCRLLWECQPCQWLFEEFFIFISSLSSIDEIFLTFHDPPPLLKEEPPKMVLPGTIMVTCEPVDCNKLKGPSWLILLMITNNTATAMNQGVVVDALIHNIYPIFVNSISTNI